MTQLLTTGRPDSSRAGPADLICLWRFGDPDGLVSRGPHAAELQPVGPLPARVDDGPWGGALRFEGCHQLRLASGRLGPLCRGGAADGVTVIAWMRRRGETPWQFVGGLWDETRSLRQYGLFLNARALTREGQRERIPCSGRVHGHVSATGGPTPGERVCLSYATGATAVPLDRWVSVAMSFDGRASRAFVDGELDPLPGSNPYRFPCRLCPEAGSTEFTVGANSVAGETRNFLEADLAALAVYARALEPDELRRACSDAGPRAPLEASP